MEKKRLVFAISAVLSLVGLAGCSSIAEIKASSILDDEQIVVYHIENRQSSQLTIRHATYDEAVRVQTAILDNDRMMRRKVNQTPRTVDTNNMNAFEREVNRLYSSKKRQIITPQQVSRNSLWSRITRGYRLKSNIEKTAVKKALKQCARNPQHLNRVFNRSGEYLHVVLHELNRRRMPTELALLPMIESGYNNRLKSRTGGVGLWQLNASKGKSLALKQTATYDARLDVFASTHATLNNLQLLNKKFAGDWYLTLASYKLGAKKVQQAINKNRLSGKATDYWHLNLPKNTTESISKLLAYREMLLRPHAYGLKLPVVTNKPQIIQVANNKAVDLRKVARAAELPASTLVRLNLNFKNGISDPRFSRKIVLPRLHAKQLHQALLAPNL